MKKRKLNMKKVLVTIITLIMIVSSILFMFKKIDNNNQIIENNIVTEQIIENEEIIAEESVPEPVVEQPDPAQEQVIEEKINPITMYTTTGVNIRTTPKIEDNIVKTVSVNTPIQKVGEEGEWSQIREGDEGSLYYIKTSLLSSEKTIIQKPVTSRSATTTREETPVQQGDKINLGTYTLTAYCACSKCCGKATGRTASGTYATAGRTIAAPSNFAFGTKLEINGHIYTVEDRGGAINGNKIDIYFDSHQAALNFGKQQATVYKIK